MSLCGVQGLGGRALQDSGPAAFVRRMLLLRTASLLTPKPGRRAAEIIQVLDNMVHRPRAAQLSAGQHPVTDLETSGKHEDSCSQKIRLKSVWVKLLHYSPLFSFRV